MPSTLVNQLDVDVAMPCSMFLILVVWLLDCNYVHGSKYEAVKYVSFAVYIK